MKIIEDTKLAFSDVLLVPKRSPSISRSMINLDREFYDKRNDRAIGTFTPIIAANMDFVGTMDTAKELGKYNCMTALHKHYRVDELVGFFGGEFYNDGCTNKVFYSMGIADKDIEKLKEVLSKLPNGAIQNLVIDVANGYTDWFVDRVKIIRDILPQAFIMAGNVVTPNIVEELILNAGVTVVKIGIGGGSVCTTRIKTGVGYPQLSAVMECADAAHGLNAFICSDGGCTTSGDVAKAFCGGADFVMLGGMLSGHDEGGALKIEKVIQTNQPIYDPKTNKYLGLLEEKKEYMKFHGMSSKEAQIGHSGKMETYKASEGKEVLVPYRGQIKHTIQDILGGIRSTCTYIGAKSIKEMNKCATFVKTNVQENRIFNT